MFLKGLKSIKIAWFDGDYPVFPGRILDYPENLAVILLKNRIATIPSSSDYIEEAKFWAASVSPKLSNKQILETVKSAFGVDLFARVEQ